MIANDFAITGASGLVVVNTAVWLVWLWRQVRCRTPMNHGALARRYFDWCKHQLDLAEKALARRFAMIIWRSLSSTSNLPIANWSQTSAPLDGTKVLPLSLFDPNGRLYEGALQCSPL
jgi:hypothetical protein